ncbi:hypothetical protein JI664_21355 [Rhodobacter sp. NTK016B]|uniref:hypothetical protein n=1 Tax=Rhodobacter sp. NTK016B TaxID=2759676 RepID=UPI001A8E25B4|nr:hypothetical protein [Rhodobacter sp. NTK016B]MBN8294534.1 hypothetical protein [Rhodobacter sp. NTK016B]
MFNQSRPRQLRRAAPAWDTACIGRRVANVAVMDGWTLETSLALVEAMCSGSSGPLRAATATGRAPEDCRAQWERLMPVTYRGSIGNQATLLSALRAAVAQKAGAA